VYLYLTILNFFLLFFFQIIIFKLLKYKKNWHYTSLIILIIIIYVLYSFIDIKFNFTELLDYLFYNFIILINYLIFLTIVFNGSPSIFFLKNQSKKLFMKKGFVKNRIKLMKLNKLISKNNKITPMGYFTLKITNFFSVLILKDDI
jgi:hypothetical protein